MATNKRIRRQTGSALSVAAAVAMLVAPALPTMRAAEAGDWMPMLPDQDFYDFQLFAPPDLQEYNIYYKPYEGVYFNYDRLYWGVTVPQTVPVGQSAEGGYIFPTSPVSPYSIVQLNNGNIQATAANGGGAGGEGESVIGGLYTFGAEPFLPQLNTSWMRTKMGWGDRYEGGWIYENRGINVSYFTIQMDQSFSTLNEFAAASPEQIYQTEIEGGGGVPAVGDAPVINQPLVVTEITSESPPPDHLIAQKLQQRNTTEILSVGVAAQIRRQMTKRGSSRTTFGLGPRFIQFAETFNLGYEANQYPFAPGAGGGLANAVGNAGGNQPGGNQAGGNQAGGNQAGGNQVGQNQGIQVGNESLEVETTSAGTVLGISGYDTITASGRPIPLQAGLWNTDTLNNIVGPELSLLWEVERGRWEFATALKFTAGFNWQNNIYRGADFANTAGADYIRTTFAPTAIQAAGGFDNNNDLPTQLNPPPLFLQLYSAGQSNTTNSSSHRFVFSPIGEWRFGAKFKVSKGITLHAGYTGMWLSEIARASTNTGYKTEERSVQFAAPQDPSQPAGQDNPWIVKTTGPSPGNMPTMTNAQGQVVPNPYFVPNPKFTTTQGVEGASEYVFTNGIDFGLEVKF